MNNKEALQNKIEGTLNSLDNISRVGANPFLYGKIQQRLSTVRQQSVINGRWVYRLAFMLLVLLAVNVYSFSSFLNHKNSGNKASGIEAFAAEYNIQTTGDNI